MATNSYPEKPVLKYQKTTVEMGLVVPEIKLKVVPKEIKRASYIVFRNESGNGSKGINNNYVGAQADVGRWPAKFDAHITGVVYKGENGTGLMRTFLAFSSYKDSVSFLADRIQARGLYIGGILKVKSIDLEMAIVTPEDLAIGYQRAWVKGNKSYIPTEKETKDFLSMYRQAEKLFL